MKLLGHPIHTMIIHFPTALLPMDFILSYLFFKTGNASYGSGAFYCMIGGVVIGIVSMLTGLIDLIQIKKEQKEALAAGLYHGFLNGMVIIVYAVFAYRAWNNFPALLAPSITVLIVKGIAILALLVGNYIGGTLIFKHRIGIKE